MELRTMALPILISCLLVQVGSAQSRSALLVSPRAGFEALAAHVTTLGMSLAPPPGLAPTPAQTAPPRVVTTAGNAYFDSLIARPDHWKSYSLRDQAQLVAYKNAVVRGPAVNYLWPDDPDPRAQDAAKVVVSTNSNSLTNQVWLPMTTEDDHTYLVTWDAWYGAETRKSISGLSTWKTFQFRRATARNPAIWFEVRTRFDLALGPNDIGRIDGRGYSTFGPNQTDADGQPLAPQVGQFVIRPETWVRYWVMIEQHAADWDLVSLWAADEQHGAVLLLKQLQLELGTAYQSVHSFQLEFNTSADAVKVGRPELVVYVRNVAMLRDLPFGAVPSLFQRPLR